MNLRGWSTDNIKHRVIQVHQLPGMTVSNKPVLGSCLLDLVSSFDDLSEEALECFGWHTSTTELFRRNQTVKRVQPPTGSRDNSTLFSLSSQLSAWCSKMLPTV